MIASEALNARVDQLDLTPGRETIHAVGSVRTIPRRLALDTYVLPYLEAWLAERRKFPGTTVFCVVDGPTAGREWDQSSAATELRRLGTRVLNGRANANAFRFTLAAELIVEQWPLSYIQTQLGYAKVESFRYILPNLGIEAADQSDVAEIARSRPHEYVEQAR